MTGVAFDPAPFEQYLASRGSDSDCWNPKLDARVFVEQLLKRSSDLKYLRRYADACPVAGVSPEHYGARVLQVAPTCSVIAAIHFRGLAVNFPFVDVSAQSAPLPQPLPLALLIDAFVRFRPRAVRIWQSVNDSPPEYGEEDLKVVAGPLRALQAMPDLPHARRIRLEPDPELATYADYRRMYEAVHAAAPETITFANPETQSSLAECASFGAFFRVLIDDDLAGVIAARPDSYRCWRGWHIVEEVLHPDFRGRQFAPAIQQALLRQLDAEREPYVFGTISAKNTPSFRTALRVGRRVVEVGTFVALDSGKRVR
jgi:RimJ/RimL family protein N-acetyltransferase